MSTFQCKLNCVNLPTVHEILAKKAFIVTNDLISWLFVIAFVHPTYVQIALIWGFSVQLSL